MIYDSFLATAWDREDDLSYEAGLIPVPLPSGIDIDLELLPRYQGRPSRSLRRAKTPRKCRRSEYRRDTISTSRGRRRSRSLYNVGNRPMLSLTFLSREGLAELELDAVELAYIQTVSEEAWSSDRQEQIREDREEFWRDYYEEIFHRDCGDWFDHAELYEPAEPTRSFSDDYDVYAGDSIYGVYIGEWFD